MTGPLRWPWIRLSLFRNVSPEPQAEEPVLREKLRFLGLDVHAETIVVAVAEPDGEVRSLGTIANREDSICKFIKKLGPSEHLRACYEAGPTGFVLYWQLTQLGVDCKVVAPSLVPKKPGDRVKTDRRDALKLARSHRCGDLTAVWVPDEDSEALRDLVRQREAAKQDQLRARHRLTKFLLRTGQRPPLGLKAWTERYVEWVQQVRYAQPARQAELGNISSRFESARKLMGYSGVFPSEDSSGKRVRKGGITKAGNAHLRRIVVESAWCYRHLPRVGAKLRKRQQGVPAEIIETAWKAQNRLHKRYVKMTMAGKDPRKIMTAMDENCSASSGPSGSRLKRRASNNWRHNGSQKEQKQRLSK